MSRETKKQRQPQQYDPKHYYYGRPALRKPDFRAIHKALESFSGKEDEPDGTVEYIRARLQSRVDCPLCAYYDAWNVDDLQDHIANHKEEYRTLRDRRELLLERLGMLRRAGMNKEERERKVEGLEIELRILESKIKKFRESRDTRAVATVLLTYRLLALL
jgi:hypothetical protein